MDAEFLQLAQEAVAALQGPSWVEIAQLGISGGGPRYQRGGSRGDPGGIEADGGSWPPARPGKLMSWRGAFRKQGEAMTQAFTQQGQALERQGQVLAELLRRTA